MSLLRVVAVAFLLFNVGRLHEAFSSFTGSLPVAKVLLALGALALAMSNPLPRIATAWTTKPAKALAAFSAAILLSVPFSYYRTESIEISLQFFLASIPIVMITVLSIRQIEDLERLFRTATAVVLVEFVLIAAGFGADISDGEGARVSLGGSYDPNDLAIVTATCLPFCVWTLRDRSFAWRAIGLVALLGGMFVVVKTGSRGGFLAVATMLTLLVLATRSFAPAWLRLAMIPAFIGAIVLAPESYRDRLLTLTALSEDYNTSAISGRQEIWKRGAVYFAKRPLTGVGIGQFQVAEGRWGADNGYERGWKWSAPHSMYVESAAELGIFGVGALLALLGSGLQFTRRTAGVGLPKAHPDKRVAAAGSALFLALCTFGVGAAFITAALSPAFMLLASLIIGFEVLVRDRRNGVMPGSVAPRSRHFVRNRFNLRPQPAVTISVTTSKLRG
ncbi:O-antigen ligase family protein [Gemmatimonas phototrophica]|uniref:O-antigen ligase family protein n=1 Tax=Gemmatimonas phototrophica TaxID=1379270 RepID=UPI000A81A888|nr:O-antigen ligase family protein [Gemmatimonas phototrophica]